MYLLSLDCRILFCVVCMCISWFTIVFECSFRSYYYALRESSIMTSKDVSQNSTDIACTIDGTGRIQGGTNLEWGKDPLYMVRTYSISIAHFLVDFTIAIARNIWMGISHKTVTCCSFPLQNVHWISFTIIYACLDLSQAVGTMDTHKGCKRRS